MSSTSGRGPVGKPVAILIAARMRASPGGGAKPHKPINVNKALRKAMSGSPVARSAFKQNKAAVDQARPHLRALANRQGQGALSSLKHGVSAMRSLRQVTRDMAKQGGDAPMKVTSNVDLNPRAQKHLDGISRAMQGPKPNLFSALGQGIGLMRELRGTTRQMTQEAKRESLAPMRSNTTPRSGDAGPHGRSRALSVMPPPATGGGGQGTHLLQALAQGMTLMRGARQLTQAMTSQEIQGVSLRQQASPRATTTLSRGGSGSPLAIMLVARGGGPTGGQGAPWRGTAPKRLGED